MLHLLIKTAGLLWGVHDHATCFSMSKPACKSCSIDGPTTIMSRIARQTGQHSDCYAVFVGPKPKAYMKGCTSLNRKLVQLVATPACSAIVANWFDLKIKPENQLSASK